MAQRLIYICDLCSVESKDLFKENVAISLGGTLQYGTGSSTRIWCHNCVREFVKRYQDFTDCRKDLFK